MTDATYVKVLSLHEGVQAQLSVLRAPVPSNHAVPHHNPLLHPGIDVEGDVLRSAHHEVEDDSAAQIRQEACSTCLSALCILHRTNTHLSAPWSTMPLMITVLLGYIPPGIMLE